MSKSGLKLDRLRFQASPCDQAANRLIVITAGYFHEIDHMDTGLLVIMMTVMMTVVSVAYWRWNSRVTEKNVSFRSEVFTLAQQPELKEEDIPVLHQLNEEYSRVARLVERVLVSIDTTGVTSVPQPSEDGDFMIERG